MTTTHTAPATDLTDVSSSTGVILASDFSEYVTDNDRHTWTIGKMRHVIAALGNRRVAIVTDKQTGHTCFNVCLVCIVPGGGGRADRVQIEYVHASGESHFTNYLLFEVGPCITLMPSVTTDNRDKWTALNTWRDEVSAAKNLFHAHRVAEGLDKAPGKYEVRPTAYGAVVSFQPDHDRAKRDGLDHGHPFRRFAFREFRASEITAELDRQEQVTARYAAESERKSAGVEDACEM